MTEEQQPRVSRHCLRCRKKFLSVDRVKNQICPACKAINDRQSVRHLDIRPVNFEDDDFNFGSYFTPRR